MLFIFVNIKSKIFSLNKKIIEICISRNLKQTMHTMYNIYKQLISWIDEYYNSIM
jgi:hypothetical protein